MATDGPRLMEGDDGSWFCSEVYSVINNGQLDMDHLLKQYKKDLQKSYRDDNREFKLEEYRFMAELVKVLHQGRVKEELWSEYGYDDNGKEITIYDVLDKAIISRETLELLFKKSKKHYIHMNGIGFEYYGSIEYLREYFSFGGDPLRGYNLKEKEQLDKIMEGLKKLPCNNLEDAQKIRDKLKNIKNKYKILGCGNKIINDINSVLYHGWRNEEYYLIMLNSVKDNITVIKEILDNPKEKYVLYTKTK